MGKGTKAKKKSLLRSGFGTVIYLLVVWCGALLLVKYVVQRTIVDGISMENTLENGDNLLVDKLSYRFMLPERYDIVLFPAKDNDGKEILLIKRIVGMPGDKVQIRDGQLYINDVRLANDPHGDIVLEYAGRAAEPIYLAEDEYFVMGDNRNNSRDSRYENVGNVKKDNLVGKAVFRMSPLHKIGRVN